MMTTVSVHEAKAHLSSLLADIEDHGETVLICRYGRAVAQLVPVRRSKRTQTDARLSRIVLRTDPCRPTTEEWEHA